MRWIALFGLLLASCSSGEHDDRGAIEIRECSSQSRTPTDVAGEPDWRRHADYVEWGTTEGCMLRIDVIAQRSGAEHCGFHEADVLITGRSMGSRYRGPGSAIHYIRDPNGVFDDERVERGFVADARLPDGARHTGYVSEVGDELWVVPGADRAVFIVGADRIAERWPAGEEPYCA
jgi:hypothetical protein